MYVCSCELEDEIEWGIVRPKLRLISPFRATLLLAARLDPVVQVANRVESRFRRGSRKPVMSNVRVLDENPQAAIDSLIAAYPEAETTLIADEDIAFFIDLCADLRNGKPVNFVPEIDAHLDYWFKKDSLWMSEELDAVASANQETLAEAAQRVVTLQVHSPFHSCRSHARAHMRARAHTHTHTYTHT